MVLLRENLLSYLKASGERFMQKCRKSVWFALVSLGLRVIALADLL